MVVLTLFFFINLFLFLFSITPINVWFLLLFFCSLGAWYAMSSLNLEVANHQYALAWFEYIFIYMVLFFLACILALSLNLAWLVFFLEYQSFIILGSCFLFKSFNLSINGIEGSINYVFPAFFSFVFMLLFILAHWSGGPLSAGAKESVFILFYISIFINMGIFPFNAWVPAAFAGFSLPVLVFIGVVSKSYLLSVVIVYINAFSFILVPIGSITVFIASIYLTNAVNINNFLAYSSIANGGWILCFLGCYSYCGPLSITPIKILILFFFIYSFNFILLVILLFFQGSSKVYNLFLSMEGENQSIITLFAMLFSLLSMAGIPPFAGFIGNFLLFVNLYNQSITLAIFLMLCSPLWALLYLKPILSFINTSSPINLSLHLSQTNQPLMTSFFTLFHPFLMILNLYITFIVLS